MKPLNLNKIKHLIECTSKDESRAYLMCIKVDHEKQRFIACDGYKMAQIPFDDEDREVFTESILLSRDFLKQVTKGTKNFYMGEIKEDKFHAITNGIKYSISIKDYPNASSYPALDSIAPKTSDDDFTITLNYEYLIKLGKALSDSRTKKISLTIHRDVNNKLNALGVMTITGDNGNGFLMPMKKS